MNCPEKAEVSGMSPSEEREGLCQERLFKLKVSRSKPEFTKKMVKREIGLQQSARFEEKDTKDY